MPRFQVVKVLPARYVEIHVVDAGSKEEAQSAVQGGISRCKRRSFETTPGMAQPSFTPVAVLDEFAATSAVDFAYPEGEVESMREFNNARFLDNAGDDLQRAVHDVDP